MEDVWKTVPIREVYEGLYDGPHATPSPSAEGPVFLGIKNVTDDGHLDLCEIRHIAEDEYARWTRRVEPTAGDIVFTYEATLNRYAVIPRGFRGCLGRRMALIRTDPRKVSREFLFYYFFSPAWREVISNNTISGSTVDRIPLVRFNEFPVRVPSLPLQTRIAAILSAYDEMIENSQQRIRILEAMARSLYQEWFVKFRFPRYAELPLVASPIGDIPQGWEVVSLDAIKAAQPYAINGGPFGSKLGTKDYVAEGVPVIRGSNLSESGRFNPSEFAFVSEKKAEELRANLAVPGDIVVTQRGTLGQIGMIPTGIGYNQFVISQSQMKITLNPKKINREYAFFFLRSEEAIQRIKNMASSSGVPHVNLAVLREFQTLLPPFELQQKFGKFALSTEAAIEALMRQIQNLRRTRNLLLPRLLSGQLNLEPA